MKVTAMAAVLALAGASASAQQDISVGTGAVLRGLDKVDGDVTDVTLASGGVVDIGRLKVELRECRYPVGNPSGDAYAFLVIREDEQIDPMFSGWMIASSPALNALEHQRYDVWVMRCSTE